MERDDRKLRREAEHDALRALRADSSILELEAMGDPPDGYIMTFRGKGLVRNAATRRVEIVDCHRVEVWLHSAFPISAPDIRWLTPLFHPNVSYTGVIHLPEVELPWDPKIGLEILAEKFWDMVRMAYFNPERTSNPIARKWLEEQSEFSFPLDARPLRDARAANLSNVFRYHRIGQKKREGASSVDREVIYIGDETPVPEFPASETLPRRPRGDEGELFYIGDE